MAPQDQNLVKIKVRFYSNVLEECTVETLWASTVDDNNGLYKIENIPFYASIASDDIVFAEYDETEKMLIYRETVEYSGNSIIQVVVMKQSILANDIRDIFKTLKCTSEKFTEGYFVIEIPADTDYKPVKQKLAKLQDQGIIDYAEPVLSENHQY